MKTLFIPVALSLTLFAFSGCSPSSDNGDTKASPFNPKVVEFPMPDSTIAGKTYLSVYSEIYSQTEHRTHNLTATISIRNINPSDTVFITKAEYFDTRGNSIRNYVEQPVFLVPMETVEIVIEQRDEAGGSGANFVFDWQVKPLAKEPFFEAVMISTSGQQGISFTTQGRRIE